MNLQEFVGILRSRWITVFATALITITVTVGYTLIQTPMYQATTGLFVSTNSSDSASDLYQGSRYSQERVVSYMELLAGETLASRTIERLNLDIDTEELQDRISAKSKPNTVIINVSVLDESPVRARDIANALTDEFVLMTRELEAPAPGVAPEARVVVVQRASTPRNPVIPQRARNIALGTLLGGILGVGLAVLRDQLDNTVKTQDGLVAITGTSAVGQIPLSKSFDTNHALLFDNDNSIASEAFRKIRTNLRFLAVDDPPHVIVITSSAPGEGKSTTAINIGLVLAEAKYNVVLVDGDLRRPSLAKYLEMPGVAGLSTVLSGGAPIKDVLQETRFPGLSLLAAGLSPPNPSELLGSLAAKKLWNELRSQFDFVIIDSPPLLAVTDGAVLAAETDGALVIARAGKTKRDQLMQAIMALDNVNAKTLGLILNMVPNARHNSYSYDYSRKQKE